MGITPLHARLIVLEHKRRPLPETIHLLGRQTVYLTEEDAKRMLQSCGVEPAAAATELDVQTIGAAALQGQYISDRMFFAMLGAKNVLAIDYTDYEGAEIIIDLNAPVPQEHVGTIDFLFCGSVLDNIFDPATYITNVSRLLKPGGRVCDQNIISQAHHPYLILTPGWMLDYYVVNRFSNYTIYITEHSAAGFVHVYGMVPAAEEMVSDFGPPRGAIPIGITVIAEKARHSTSDRLPIQDQYRTESDKAYYRESVLELAKDLELPTFGAPTAQELVKLGLRSSKSFRYLGVLRPGDLSLESTQPFVGALPDQSTVGGMRIIEATYGASAVGTPPPAASVCAAFRGNVTETIASLANGHERWEWRVDVHVLGDPLPTVGKDLEVLYYFANEPGRPVRRAYLAAEAAGKTLVLSREDQSGAQLGRAHVATQ